MADDIENAEIHLNKGSSPFHQVCINVQLADIFHVVLGLYTTARSRCMRLYEGNVGV